MTTAEVTSHIILLGSQGQPKIDGTIGGFRVANPLDTKEGLTRDFLVVRDSKKIPGTVEFQRVRERSGNNQPMEFRTWKQRNPNNFPSDFQSTFSESVLIYARNSSSGQPEQPIVDARRKLDQGFKGASHRVRFVRDANRDSSHPIDYNFIVGIENAQVIFEAEDNKGRPIEIAEDVGFVVIEDRIGQRSYTHSAGVTLGDNHGMDYFFQSEKNEFTVPSASFYNPDDRHDPHYRATGQVYTRAGLLIPPIASALRQLKTS
jgi:hypothetical protein